MGATLIEVAVALTILGIGLGLATRTLDLAARELATGDLGARAILLLSEIHDREGSESESGSQFAGPGLLRFYADPEEIRVDYEPPDRVDGRGEKGWGGYAEAGSWSLRNLPL
jgi:hypothetical protein